MARKIAVVQSSDESSNNLNNKLLQSVMQYKIIDKAVPSLPRLAYKLFSHNAND